MQVLPWAACSRGRPGLQGSGSCGLSQEFSEEAQLLQSQPVTRLFDHKIPLWSLQLTGDADQVHCIPDMQNHKCCAHVAPAVHRPSGNGQPQQ